MKPIWIDLDAPGKADLVKHRHDSAAKHLQWLTETDLRIVFGFGALQFGVSAWLAGANTSVNTVGRWGLGLLDFLILAAACWWLFNNGKRRDEFAGTIGNCNEALGYSEEGLYVADKQLHVSGTRYPQFWPNLVFMFAAFGVVVAVLARG